MHSEQVERWQNWSGSVQAIPRQIVKPHSVDELARLIGAYGRDGRRVRVAGAGHSFTPLVQSDDVLVSLDELQGIEKIDTEHSTVTVLGGTRLKSLGEALYVHGLAQENLGDIDVQSISGAISTGTHGTGVRFGTLSTQVERLTLVTAAGELLECSPERDPAVFKAAQVSLGMLGVIARVALRAVPARRMRFQSHRERLEVAATCGATSIRSCWRTAFTGCSRSAAGWFHGSLLPSASSQLRPLPLLTRSTIAIACSPRHAGYASRRWSIISRRNMPAQP